MSHMCPLVGYCCSLNCSIVDCRLFAALWVLILLGFMQVTVDCVVGTRHCRQDMLNTGKESGNLKIVISEILRS